MVDLNKMCDGCSSEVEHELHKHEQLDGRCQPETVYLCDYCFVAHNIRSTETMNLACMFNVLENKLKNDLANLRSELFPPV